MRPDKCFAIVTVKDIALDDVLCFQTNGYH